jgi:hypothetical protein
VKLISWGEKHALRERDSRIDNSRHPACRAV